MASLLGKSGKVPYRSGIRRQDVQDLPRQHLRQAFFCPQNRQRTQKPASIELLVKFHLCFLSSDKFP